MLANYYERPNEERIAVLATGVVGAAGHNIAEYWRNVCAGQLPARLKVYKLGDIEASYFVADTGDRFGLEKWTGGKQAKRDDDFTNLAVAAGIPALIDAGILEQVVKPDRITPAKYRLHKVTPDRLGVRIGVAVGGSHAIEQGTYDILRGRFSGNLPHPNTIPNLNHARAATAIGKLAGATGLQLTVNMACSSGLVTIEEASDQIILGKADVIAAGGFDDSAHMFGLKAFEVFGALAPSDIEKLKDADGNFIHPSRSFRRDAMGLVIGRGGGILVLARLDFAIEHKLPIKAEVAGSYSFTDPRDELDPTAANVARLVRGTLESAGLEPTDINAASLHAAGTLTGDPAEIAGQKEVFGDHAPDVTLRSAKINSGHQMGGTGGTKAAEAVEIVNRDTIPQTPYGNLIDSQGFDFAQQENRYKRVDAVLVTTLGLDGQHSGAVIVKTDPRYKRR